MSEEQGTKEERDEAQEHSGASLGVGLLSRAREEAPAMFQRI